MPIGSPDASAKSIVTRLSSAVACDRELVDAHLRHQAPVDAIIVFEGLGWKAAPQIGSVVAAEWQSNTVGIVGPDQCPVRTAAQFSSDKEARRLPSFGDTSGRCHAGSRFAGLKSDFINRVSKRCHQAFMGSHSGVNRALP